MTDSAVLPVFPFETDAAGAIRPDFGQLLGDDPLPLARLASGGTAYLVPRYRDVRRVLSDPVFSRAAAQHPDAAVLSHASKLPQIMLNMDPPEHTRVRRLVVRAFTTGAAERMRPRTQAITDHLIDEMVAAGPPVDFVRHFAVALPALVISEMLGVPGEHRGQLREWLTITLSVDAYPAEVVQATFSQLFQYLTGLISAKRAAPADDLVSNLIAARDEDESLTEMDLVYTIFILIAGGYDTTASLLANALLVLRHHPDQLAALRASPAAIPRAVEEFLRVVPIAWSSVERITTADTELAGVRIPAGSTVIPLTYSANQDDELVADPLRLDITRPPSAHVAFGHGVHRCVGATLAKVELETAFATLFRRLPELRPALADVEIEWKVGLLAVGPVALPVVW
jgi:cytochrome P450